MAQIKMRLMTGASVAVLAAAMSGAAAFGAGFEIREQSATAQGSALAGATASAEDISMMAFNPAAIAYHKGFQTLVNGSVIFPTADVSGASGSTVFGSSISGGSSVSDDFALVPALYASAQLSDEWFAGLAVTAPFGLVTEYDDDWVGRYHGVRSELRTINVSPTIAFRPSSKLSVAVGAQVQYIDAELTNAVDFGVVGASAGAPGAAGLAGGGADGFAKVAGDDFGFGFTLGAIYEPVPGTRLGVAYKSQIDHRLKGEADFTYDAVGIGAGVNAATGAFTDGGGIEADYLQPAKLNIGLYHELSPKWAVMADAQWTQWSTFDELRIEFDDATPDNVTNEDWDDQWFFSVGARYKPTDEWSLRAGVGFDQGASPDETRTPRIPDANRLWLSLGASYEVSDKISVTAGYSYIHAEDSTIALSATGDNASRGALNADVEGDAHIIAISGRIQF